MIQSSRHRMDDWSGEIFVFNLSVFVPVLSLTWVGDFLSELRAIPRDAMFHLLYAAHAFNVQTTHCNNESCRSGAG